ncbi:MAG: Hsp70 family protein [Culturomica sp.]|jgi:molecular chaperone DnaK (HSP70)|nr:Hsp70 family protein [Culturomica sp.]
MDNWMSIDFGTSSSAVAIIRNETPELAPPLDSDAVDSKLFSSVAYVDKHENIWTCRQAELMGRQDPSRFLREFKLDIRDGRVLFDSEVTYVQLVAEILKTMKEAAERFLNDSIENLVLTVPATYYDDDEKTIVMKQAAGECGAGFKRIEILKEAQAAAVYYDYLEGQSGGRTLVYDLGGGTFDAVIVEHLETEYRLVGHHAGLEVGGKFFTEKILLDYLVKAGIGRRQATNDHRQRCEEIKRQLSYRETLPPITGESYTLTRSEFEHLISSDLDKTLESCGTLLRQTELQWSDLNRVLLIGGSCRIPLVRQKIEGRLHGMNAENTHIVWQCTENKKTIDPQSAVALGAAVYAMRKFIIPPPEPVTIGVLRNSFTGELYALKEGENVFGRSTNDADFAFPKDERMSRRHFSIEVTFNGSTYEYRLTDLRSSHGTIVDNMALSHQYTFAPTSAVLKGGEKISAGTTKFDFTI